MSLLERALLLLVVYYLLCLLGELVMVNTAVHRVRDRVLELRYIVLDVVFLGLGLTWLVIG